jgi:hypothetical protein
MKNGDDCTDAEATKRMEDGQRRALSTPHKPHAMIKAKPKPKPRRPLIQFNRLHKRADSRK